MPRGGKHTFAAQGKVIFIGESADVFAVKQLMADRDDVAVLAKADHAVHLRHLCLNLVLIAFCQAAGNQNLLNDALLLEFAAGEDRFNGLLLCRVDKAAGVDDDEVGVFDVVRNLKIVLQLCEHQLRVHLILRAAESDHADFFHSISSKFSTACCSACLISPGA